MKDKFLKDFIIKLTLYLSIFLMIFYCSYYSSMQLQRKSSMDKIDNHRLFQTSSLNINKNSIFIFFTVNDSLIQYYDILPKEFYFNFYLRKKRESQKLKMNKCRYFSEEFKSTIDGFCLSEKIELINSISKNYSSLYFEIEICDDESKNCLKKFELSKYKVHINNLILVNGKLAYKPLFKYSLVTNEKLTSEISLSNKVNIIQKNEVSLNDESIIETNTYKELKKQILGIESEKYLTKFNEKQISNDIWYNLYENSESKPDNILPSNFSLEDEKIYKLMLIKDLEYVKIKQEESYKSKINNKKYDPFDFYISNELFGNHVYQKQNSTLSKLEIKFVNSGSYEETIIFQKLIDFQLIFITIFCLYSLLTILTFRYIEKINYYIDFINNNFVFKQNTNKNSHIKLDKIKDEVKIKKEFKLELFDLDLSEADETINHKNLNNIDPHSKVKDSIKQNNYSDFDKIFSNHENQSNDNVIVHKSNSHPIISYYSMQKADENQIRKTYSFNNHNSKYNFEVEEPFYSFMNLQENNQKEKDKKNNGFNHNLEINKKDYEKNHDCVNSSIFTKIRNFFIKENKDLKKEKDKVNIDLNSSISIEKSLIHNNSNSDKEENKNTIIGKINNEKNNNEKEIRKTEEKCNPIFLNTHLDVEKYDKNGENIIDKKTKNLVFQNEPLKISFCDYIILSVFNFFSIFNLSFFNNFESKRIFLNKTIDFIKRSNENIIIENIERKKDLGLLRYLALNLDQNNLFNFIIKRTTKIEINDDETEKVHIWPDKLINIDIDDINLETLKFKYKTKFKDRENFLHPQDSSNLFRNDSKKSNLITESFYYTDLINFKLSKLIYQSEGLEN